MKTLVTLLCILAVSPLCGQSKSPQNPARARLVELEKKLADTIAKTEPSESSDFGPADVEVFHKAVQWALRYPEEFYTPKYEKDAIRVAEIGLRRAIARNGGKTEWKTRTGWVARGYRSNLDDSVQPYGLVVPRSLDRSKSYRLDVVLHGRNGKLSEISFLAKHERPDAKVQHEDRIELHVFGRTNNAYRWSGENDVLQALYEVRKAYPIDDERIVLRGFSMGGAGAWHLGLHYPSLWAAVEAGAGFSETINYARLPNLPLHQKKALTIYDAKDYAINLLDTPFVGYGGENDGQLQAATNIHDALVAEGFKFERQGLDREGPFLFLVGPKTGHKFHPDSKARSEKFIATALTRERDPRRTRRFVTYTPAYGRADWVRVEALGEMYERAEVKAMQSKDGAKLHLSTENVRAFQFDLKPSTFSKVFVDDQEISGSVGSGSLWRDDEGRWNASPWKPKTAVKRFGLHGPIDDAFRQRFVCVEPTGKPWNKKADLAARKRLQIFQKEYPKWLRADVPTRKDSEVQLAKTGSVLVLFGDPGSNSVLAELLPQLPLTWTKDSIVFAGKTYPSASHLPAMVFPVQMGPAKKLHYVVLNSGHTFGEKEFRGTNAKLFPRLGDHAILQVDDAGKVAAVHAAGFFDSNWQVKK